MWLSPATRNPYTQQRVLFSGADDCVFAVHDVRAPLVAAARAVARELPAGSTLAHARLDSAARPGSEGGEAAAEAEAEEPAKLFADRRTHGSGVCTVSPSPHEPHVVVTGSYDESVRLWDVRQLVKPLLVAQAGTGGGNWRLRWHPQRRDALLAACMCAATRPCPVPSWQVPFPCTARSQLANELRAPVRCLLVSRRYNGFAVLRADAAAGQLHVTTSYGSPDPHVAYGADWWCGGDRTNAAVGAHADGGAGQPALVALCSFYSRLFSLVWLPLPTY
jgi:hypothetical protein